MNTSRFLTVLAVVASDLDDLKVGELVGTMTTALSASVSEPTAPRAAAFEEARDIVLRAAQQCRSRTIAPSLQTILATTGIDTLVGTGLERRLTEILEASAVTPARVAQNLQKLRAEITQTQQRVKSLLEGLAALGIEQDELEGEQYEVGVLIPSSFVDGELGKLQKELAALDRHMKTFSELAGQPSSSPKLRGLSSTDPQVFLLAASSTAALVATAIERIVALYKTTLEIRLLRSQLEEKGISEKSLEPIRKEEQQKASAELDKLADELVKNHAKGVDAPRRNELKGFLSKALHWIADRFDRGVTFEVSAPPPAETSDTEDGQAADFNTVQQRALVERARHEIEANGQSALGIERQPEPILMLTAPEDEEDKKGKPGSKGN